MQQRVRTAPPSPRPQLKLGTLPLPLPLPGAMAVTATAPGTPRGMLPPDDEVVQTREVHKQRDEHGRTIVNQYLILEEIGKGMHGKVRKAMDLDTGEYWAVKIVNRTPKRRILGLRTPTTLSPSLSSPSDSFSPSSSLSPSAAFHQHVRKPTDEKIRKEIAILKKCRHQNVVRLREVIDDGASRTIFMVLELMDGGEVQWKHERFSEAGERIDEPSMTVEEARKTFRDVVLGLEYLHYQGIIHRDIKPANLLWTSDRTVKISDFGVSHFSYALRSDPSPTHSPSGPPPSPDEPVFSDHDLAKTAGSPAFFAPELCHQGRPGMITNAIDIWALGVTLYCLLFGTTPFTAESEYALMNVIPAEDIRFPPEMGADRVPVWGGDEGEQVRDLLCGLLEKDSQKRITLAEVKAHPWVLRNLEAPTAWLADTDVNASPALVVSHEEVASALTFKSRLKRGWKNVVTLLSGSSGGRRRSGSQSSAAETTEGELDSGDATVRARSSVRIPSGGQTPGRISPSPAGGAASSPGQSRQFSLLGPGPASSRARSPVPPHPPSSDESTPHASNGSNTSPLARTTSISSTTSSVISRLAHLPKRRSSHQLGHSPASPRTSLSSDGHSSASERAFAPPRPPGMKRVESDTATVSATSTSSKFGFKGLFRGLSGSRRGKHGSASKDLDGDWALVHTSPSLAAIGSAVRRGSMTSSSSPGTPDPRQTVRPTIPQPNPASSSKTGQFSDADVDVDVDEEIDLDLNLSDDDDSDTDSERAYEPLPRDRQRPGLGLSIPRSYGSSNLFVPDDDDDDEDGTGATGGWSNTGLGGWRPVRAAPAAADESDSDALTPRPAADPVPSSPASARTAKAPLLPPPLVEPAQAPETRAGAAVEKRRGSEGDDEDEEEDEEGGLEIVTPRREREKQRQRSESPTPTPTPTSRAPPSKGQDGLLAPRAPPPSSAHDPAP